MKSAIAVIAFVCLVAGVAMMSVPWSLVVGGGLVLGIAIAGELR